jgi:hypothetical protein
MRNVTLFTYIFICSIFNDAVNNWDYLVSYLSIFVAWAHKATLTLRPFFIYLAMIFYSSLIRAPDLSSNYQQTPSSEAVVWASMNKWSKDWSGANVSYQTRTETFFNPDPFSARLS